MPTYICTYAFQEVADLNETDLKSIIELKIEQSKVLATQASNENGSRDQVKCIVDALAIFQHFSSTVDASRYRTVKFPIYSIHCTVLVCQNRKDP